MTIKRQISISAIFSMSVLSGCVMDPQRHPMSGWDHMMGYGGGWLMWLLLLIAVGILVYLIFAKKNVSFSGGSSAETPLEILKKRYAKGEISKEEFDRMRRDLDS
jgi:putative membrane protein